MDEIECKCNEKIEKRTGSVLTESPNTEAMSILQKNNTNSYIQTPYIIFKHPLQK
jgi:hypothetical protein